jgi:hypothetical protein
MPSGDEYRVKAAEIMEKAREEADPLLFSELAKLAFGYLRLAEQADRNALTDLVYEPPSHVQQQQQQQQGQQQQQQQQSGTKDE